MLDRICDNCMSRVPVGTERCPKCGVHFENTNPGGALPNGWVLGGRYTVGRYIEIDGEGVTYSAIDGNTLQRVTIKEFMPVTLCSTRDETGSIIPKPGCEVLFKTTRMDFADMYGNLMRLGLVEGLVQVLDVLDENNTAYGVLEKVEGPTLAEYLIKNSLPMEHTRALAMLRPLFIGVDTLHSANVIHRGICPENIILESGGTAKLAGYATLALRQQGSELKPKLYSGYSAPEQYAASEFEGRYTDVYSFGAVLYRLVTGETPVPADERKIQDTLRAARQVDKEVPNFLSAGIARAMRVIPAERIQNIPDLRLAFSGEGGKEAKGPLGLSKQQLIVGAAALGAVILLVLIILLVSIFGGKGDDDSSSLSSSTSSSVSVAENVVPNLVGKVYDDVVKGSTYKDFIFASPTQQYDDTIAAGIIISQTPAEGTAWDGKTPIALVVSQGPQPISMPDLVTKETTKDQAEEQLKELNILYTFVTEENDGSKDENVVLRTDPKAGEEVVPNKDKVTVYITGAVSAISLPDVTGLTEAEAKAELDRNKITNYTVRTVDNDRGMHMNGKVGTTSPAAGSSVEPGKTTVTLSVYDSYYMPSLTEYYGQRPESHLIAFLDEHRIPYRYGDVTYDDKPGKVGRIASIDHSVNQLVTSDTVVVIHLYALSPVTSTPVAPSTPDVDASLPPEG